MIQDVLVDVYGGETPGKRAAWGREFAEAMGAKARGFALAPLPLAPYGPGAERLTAAYQEACDRITADARRESEAIRAAHQIETEVLAVGLDRVRVDAASAMRSADVVIVEAPRGEATAARHLVFEAALLSSGRPVIALPPHYEQKLRLDSIAIAWKDCREAARAVHDSMPILAKAKNLRVLTATHERDADFLGRAALEALLARLRRLPGTVTSEIVGAHDAEAQKSLIEATSNADMVVMGGYGRAQFLETLFGGVTRGMIEHANIPVFLSH